MVVFFFDKILQKKKTGKGDLPLALFLLDNVVFFEFSRCHDVFFFVFEVRDFHHLFPFVPPLSSSPPLLSSLLSPLSSLLSPLSSLLSPLSSPPPLSSLLSPLSSLLSPLSSSLLFSSLLFSSLLCVVFRCLCCGRFFFVLCCRRLFFFRFRVTASAAPALLLLLLPSLLVLLMLLLLVGLACSLEVSRSTLWRAPHEDLEARFFKPVRAPRLTAENRLALLNFCLDVLQCVGVLSIRGKRHLQFWDLTRVVFSDEKFFRWNYTEPAQKSPIWVVGANGRPARKTDLDPDVCINEHSQRNPGTMAPRW